MKDQKIENILSVGTRCKLERGRTKGSWGRISQQLFAFILFQYIELSLPPRCLSISCIHFVSYVDFPYWPPRHFLRFFRTSPASTTSCVHLVSISKFHPPRAIVSTKNHKQDNASQFVGNLCELRGQGASTDRRSVEALCV